jgi:hypothetical protein
VPRFNQFVNAINLRLCQDALGIQFTEEMTPLAPHVVGVVAKSSEKEVLRVYASRIVASVEDCHTVRYFTTVQFI